MDVADNEMVVLGPIVPVHLGFIRIYIVGEDDSPSLPFESKADESDAREELSGSEGMPLGLLRSPRSCSPASVSAWKCFAQPWLTSASTHKRQILLNAPRRIKQL